MTRSLAAIAALLLAIAACGDDTGSEPEATIVTVADLGLELPVALPGDIPAPSNGVYAGELLEGAPWHSIHIGSDFDPEALRAAIRDFGEAVGATYDPAIEQIVYVTNIEGEEKAVYAWVRTTDAGDHSTLLEIGTSDLID